MQDPDAVVGGHDAWGENDAPCDEAADVKAVVEDGRRKPGEALDGDPTAQPSML